ncbi:MAG: hypothetical protein ABFS24_11510 [Pseudomonadota bacterium]
MKTIQTGQVFVISERSEDEGGGVRLTWQWVPEKARYNVIVINGY